MNSLVKSPPIGEARDRELLKDATTYVYRETAQGPLHVHLFFPVGWSPDDSCCSVLFFHGGLWETPMPTQFVPHALHFAHRGAIGITVETRTFNSHRTGPMEALEDAKALMLWLMENAAYLGLDPARIVLGGAFGGAFLALNLGMAENAEPILRPAAFILFSPLVNTTPKGLAAERFPDLKTAKKLSPTALIRKKLPPSILFQGAADRTLPPELVVSFAKVMRRKSNRCDLIDFQGAEHSFFNFNVSQHHFELTLNAADRFLVELGLLVPDVEAELD
jgi:acetyl esterase/lipase